MKKIMSCCFVAMIPSLNYADQVATSAAMSVLQTQMEQISQQITATQQTLSAVSQNLQGLQGQYQGLKQELNQATDPTLKQFKWVDVSVNQRPRNAFVAAENQGQPLYICQAIYSSGSGYDPSGGSAVTVPGVVEAKGCVITYSGQAYLVPDYAILTSNVSGYWINGDQIKSNVVRPPIYPMALMRNGAPSAAPAPSNQPKPLYNSLAIIGGQDSGSNTYICRVNINGEFFLGKSNNGTCYIAAGAYEANWPVYQVLLTRQP